MRPWSWAPPYDVLMPNNGFGSLLSCIDGRIQRPVRDFLVTRFGVPHVDTITRAGIVKHLTSGYDPATNAIIGDLEASLTAHGSTQLALVAHHDCAGNPVDDETQQSQLRDGAEYFRRRYPQLEVVGLWVGDKWTVEVIG